MWLIGVLLWMSLMSGVIALANREPRSVSSNAYWDIEGLAGAASSVVSPLASFSVAAAVFLANLTRAAQNPSFADVMALFLIAFIILMGSAIMYSTDRSIRADQQSSQNFEATYRVLYVLSTAAFFLGITMSWTGLHPLLLSIELTDLAAVFGWLLLVAILVAGVRMVALLYALLDVRLFPVAIIPIVSYASSAIYKLVLVPRFPWLWPQENAVLSFAILVFALAGMAIGIESFVILFHGERRLNELFRRFGRSILPLYAAQALAAVLFLWLSTVAS